MKGHDTLQVKIVQASPFLIGRGFVFVYICLGSCPKLQVSLRESPIYFLYRVFYIFVSQFNFSKLENQISAFEKRRFFCILSIVRFERISCKIC